MTKILPNSSVLQATNLTKSPRRFSFKRLIFSTVAILLVAANSLSAQVNVTASAGAASGSYATLKIAMDSINSGYHQGAISIAIPAAGSETAPTGGGMKLKGTGITTAPSTVPSSYTSIVINGSGTYTINANVGIATPASAIPDGMITLVGADNVTIDGLKLVDGNATNPATMV
jgi:hypothetical protein